MPRNRSHTRRQARSNPQGRIDIRRGGYGFVRTAEGEFFIPRKNMKGAFPGDLVEIAPVKRSSHRGNVSSGKALRRMARVVNVLERAHEELVGYFYRAEPFGVVRPADPLIQHDIFTQLDQTPALSDGTVVRVMLSSYPDRHTAATGTVIEILGDEDDERIAIDLLVARHKLETDFSAAAIEEAQNARVDADEALAAGYRDLQSRIIFTIDPVDARDFDDAVSLDLVSALDDVPPEGRAAHWRLGVHIADVAHYVPWGSSIDLDARRRATSVYLVDRVIPMLPEKLSNDICSLRPGESRRTMTVDLYLDASAGIVWVDPYPAVIRSRARLTYDEAQECLEGKAAVMKDIVLRIEDLSKIAKQRMHRRQLKGGLDFETVEAKVRLDGDGYPVDVELRQKTDATQLIEESMIMANEAVARYVHEAGFPCVYRVHEAPDGDALEGLVPVLQEFKWFSGINEALFKAGNPHAVQEVLTAAEGRPEGMLVATLLLRAMKRAAYSQNLDSHYGLASEAYAHFTSPIRRYPDLIVHRMLKAILFGKTQKFDQEVANLPWLAEHSSKMERTAEQAARESQETKLIELMEVHIGEVFSAIISGVATFGLFVRLENTVEGIVEMDDLGNEYFILDSVRHTLTGSDSGKQYRLGSCVAVRLVEADCRSRNLRFRLVK